MLAFAIALTGAWTALYTRGLPADLRAERREEIDCDLWEQQRLADLQREPVTGTAVQILGRLLLGMPADLAWRLEAGAATKSQRRETMNESWATRVAVLLGALVALLVVFTGFTTMVGIGGDGGVAFGLPTLLAGLAIITGLAVSRRSPQLGIGLVAVGSIAIAGLWYWLLVITIPVGLVLVGIAFARGRGFPRPAGSSPA
jgi:hypothetical protein